MENQTQPIQPQMPELTDKQMLVEILENSRKTKNYMKWQLIITVALVVVPLLAALVIVPVALNSFMSTFDILDSGRGDGAGALDQINQLLQ